MCENWNCRYVTSDYEVEYINLKITISVHLTQNLKQLKYFQFCDTSWQCLVEKF